VWRLDDSVLIVAEFDGVLFEHIVQGFLNPDADNIEMINLRAYWRHLI
jgi:hypothetical protein